MNIICFLLGLSITINILFIIVTFIVFKLLKRKKTLFDCVDSPTEFYDFFSK